MKTYRFGSDLALVYDEVETMDEGSVRAFCDFDRLPLHSFRACLARISKDIGWMYKTRYDKEKAVLVIRRIV